MPERGIVHARLGRSSTELSSVYHLHLRCSGCGQTMTRFTTKSNGRFYFTRSGCYCGLTAKLRSARTPNEHQPIAIESLGVVGTRCGFFDSGSKFKACVK